MIYFDYDSSISSWQTKEMIEINWLDKHASEAYFDLFQKSMMEVFSQKVPSKKFDKVRNIPLYILFKVD